jgi:hypothetical protein
VIYQISSPSFEFNTFGSLVCIGINIEQHNILHKLQNNGNVKGTNKPYIGIINGAIYGPPNLQNNDTIFNTNCIILYL